MALEDSSHGARSRRGFLKRSAAVGGGIAAASFLQAFGLGNVRAIEDDMATIVNLAATAETLAVTFYYAALTGATFLIGDEDMEALKRVMDAEMHHLQILQSFGGVSLTQQFYMPDRVLADARIFVDTGLKTETVYAGAYLAATHQFAVLGQPKLAATAAQHGASEAQHLTQIAHIAGLQASDLSLPAPMFYQMSDAIPALAPFLKGGAGFGESLRCPSPSEYQAALGGTMAERGKPFVHAYGMDTRNAAVARSLISRI
jgi:hypothetical protein